MSDGDARELAYLCKFFEGAFPNLPILSVLEDQERPGASSFLPFNKTPILVGKSGAIHTNGEEKLYLRMDHEMLWRLDTASQSFARLVSWLRTSVAPVMSNILAQANRPSSVTDLYEPSTVGTKIQCTMTDHASDVYDVHSDQLEPATFVRIDAHPPESEVTSRDPVISLPCYHIPYERNDDFVGREDLLQEMRERLHSYTHSGLQADSEELKTYAICGPGGMGKTQTAAHFALSSTDNYDAILWMRADTHAKLATDFNDAAVALGLVQVGSLEAKDLAITRELVKGWLSRPRRFKDPSDRPTDITPNWLLVFDNADEPEVLSEFWPEHGSIGSILVTSRDSRAKTKTYRVSHGRDIKGFSPYEGANLMVKLTGLEDQRAEAIRVAEALRGFPLALTQMSSFMVKDDLTFDRFLTLYEEGNDDIVQASSATAIYQHTVATVFAFEKLSDTGRKLLYFLSLIDSDISEQDIIEPILGKIKMSKFPSTATQYEQARDELTRSSLVLHNRKTGRLSVNILVQDAARLRMSSFEIVPVFLFAVRLLSKLWPVAGADAIRQDNSRWEQCAKLSQHALRLKDRFSKQSDGVKDELALNTQFASLLNEVGWYLQERGQSLYAIECFKIARDHLGKIIAHDQANSDVQRPPYAQQSQSLFNDLGDTNTSRALENNLDDTSLLYAETYRNLGTSAADICDVKTSYENYSKYNSLMLAQLGDDDHQTDPRLVISYLELAVAHAFRQEYQASKECSEFALTLCKWIRSPEMVMNLRTLAMANLALALLELGDYTGACNKALQALTERENRLGRDDRSSMLTGRLLHALGNIYFSLSETKESMDYHTRAMTHYKETVGPTHHRTADMYFKVAQHKYRTGQLEEARKLLDQAHEVYQKQKQHYSAERARVLHWKAKLVPVGEQGVKRRIAADSLRTARTERGVEEGTFEDNDFDEMVVFWSR
ncbi:unnamed protein product [Cercospora beticola]|nr:unnamed protein product [Cercospora beticola]